MTLGLPLYKVFSRIVSVFIGAILSRRVRQGKENASRLNERRARKLPYRPAGRIVWLHGASVGESMLLLELGKRLQADAPDIHLLFTSQTQTSAELVAKNLPPRSFHQMAPIDTPGNAKRFVHHWQPALGIMAEGEIWPNLLLSAKKLGTRLALVNARMTEKSLTGWKRWRCTAQKVFGCFDVVLAADGKTAEGLTSLLGPGVEMFGNLKSALPPPPEKDISAAHVRNQTGDQRRVLLAASTHPGEEELFLDASGKTKDLLVIAPRHPERGHEIAAQLNSRQLSFVRWSETKVLNRDTEVILADTIGDMGLWYRLADAVYLGGAHAPGIGGHNPLEPLMLGKPVVTGPDGFNFSDIMEDLIAAGTVRIEHESEQIGTALRSMPALSEHQLKTLQVSQDAPMTSTLNALLPLLEVPA